jgi:vacuolar protein-sorting-associated protein 4
VDGLKKLEPCSPGRKDAMQMTWADVKSEELLTPVVDFRDFVKAIKASRPTVSFQDLQRNAEWTEEFGSEGA